MHSLTDSALRLLRRILGTPGQPSPGAAGTPGVFDGNTAVALTEAAISEGAGSTLANSANGAQLAWRAERKRLGSNLLDGLLETSTTEGARGSLAYAAGLSMSGVRATAFLSGIELAALQDLLGTAAGRHLPLVLHVSNQALGGHSSALSSGHEICHLSADSGCFSLIAANVQEAVDFTLIARRLAEQTLKPGLVFMDVQQTALSPQEAELPSKSLVIDFLGRPADQISIEDQAQHMLFGERRRRVPRWHDPDRPVLLGAIHPSPAWGLGQAASRLYLEKEFDRALRNSLQRFTAVSGRIRAPLSSHRVEDASLVLVAIGSAIETAEAVADQVRASAKIEVGVLGLRCLRPFPAAEFAQHLERERTFCVLERLEPNLTSDPPLLRELAATVARVADGSATPEGQVKAPPVFHPKLISAVYGSGGTPLRSSDLFELCLQLPDTRQRQFHLGTRFDRPSSEYPKREVLLDRQRRHFPGIRHRGTRGPEAIPDIRPPGSVTLAVHRTSGETGGGLALSAAECLRQLAEGGLRSRPALPPAPWGNPCTDYLTWSPEALRDPGDEPAAEIAVVAASRHSGLDVRLAPGGALLICGVDPHEETFEPLFLEQLERQQGRLFTVGALQETASGAPSQDQAEEYMLGAIFAILGQPTLLDLGQRRMLTCRKSLLEHLPQKILEQRLAAFQQGFEDIREVDPDRRSAHPPSPAPSSPQALPERLRGFQSIDDAYDNLPRFWDQIGVLYRDGTAGEITPDPYLGLGAIPPFSSALKDLQGLRDRLPTLDPEACTGCGACWSLCPEGAVGVNAITPKALLQLGVDLSGKSGLRPLIARLAPHMTERCGRQGAKPATVGDILQDAFDWIQTQALPDSRKAAAAEAFPELMDSLGKLPVAITEPLFHSAEKQKSGSGCLLLLAINPMSCKACGICTTQCAPGALTTSPQSQALSREAEATWNDWEQLPAVTTETIAHSAAQPEPGPMAAALMSPNSRLSLSGGDGAEPGSGERLALRMALAAAELRQRPLVAEFLERLDTTREKISELIRKILADTLPADDLDALASGLQKVDTGQTDLAQFLTEAEQSADNRIDTLRLQRLVTLAQDLRDLSRQLTKGRQGLGRASVGLVLSTHAATGWAGGFPDNPFGVPVSVESSGDAAQLAAGLQQGQLRQAIEGMALMRKATLELESPADAARRWSKLERLQMSDLTDEERAFCPRLLVVGSSALLAGQGLSQLSSLLAGDLPVKVIVFQELDLGIAADASGGGGLDPSPLADSVTDLALLALARREAFIAQGAIGYPDHLMSTLGSAFEFNGPALIQVHTPSPKRHGFESDQTIERSRLAVASRTAPLFEYDPRESGVFGTRFSLKGNPQLGLADAEETPGEAPSTASWAVGEQRFAHCFEPLEDDAPGALPISEYLALDPLSRSGKSPYIIHAPGGERLLRMRVKPPLADACAHRLQAWRALQEIAGEVTPFTQRIREQAEQAVEGAHQAELQALRDHYETRLGNLRQEALMQTREEIRVRLMALAGYSNATAPATSDADDDSSRSVQ